MDERVAGIHRHCDSDFLVTHACLGGGIGIEVGDAFEMAEQTEVSCTSPVSGRLPASLRHSTPPPRSVTISA
ncbi:hypothetical protein [Burkholderia sp. 22PA0106]|uniref:hypothetical protein n=1 Tax=Burkholderia sp. 22PA0106 TaxID=3237371 RepID=UPI0039C15108